MGGRATADIGPLRTVPASTKEDTLQLPPSKLSAVTVPHLQNERGQWSSTYRCKHSALPMVLKTLQPDHDLSPRLWIVRALMMRIVTVYLRDDVYMLLGDASPKSRRATKTTKWFDQDAI